MTEIKKSANKEERLHLDQAVNLLWEEWKYRHEAFWGALYRWGMATVFVTIAPYLLPDLIKKLGLAVLVFPFIAFLLALFASWHMASEYMRLVSVTAKYRSLLGGFAPEKIVHSSIAGQILRLPIGNVVVAIFLFFAIVVEFFNVVILLWLIFQK